MAMTKAGATRGGAMVLLTVAVLAACSAGAMPPPVSDYEFTRIKAIEGGLCYGVFVNQKTHEVYVAAETMRGSFFGATHNPANGTWKTSDDGKTWTRIGPGGRNVKVSGSDPNVIYANEGKTLYRTDDGGANWRPILTGVGLGYRGLDICPSNHDIVYAGGNATLYVSRDGGKNWQTHPLPSVPAPNPKGKAAAKPQPAPTSQPTSQPMSFARIQSIHVSATNPDEVLFGFYDSSPGGVWRTTDGGKTFERLYPGCARGMNVSPDLQHIYCSDAASHDGGKTWEKVNVPIAWCITVHPKNPNVAFYSHPGGPVQCTIDGGKTFFQILGVERNYDGTEAEGMAIDAERDILWVGGDHIWRGENASTGRVRLVLRETGFHVISLSDIKSTPLGVWAASDAQGTHYTTDGKTWHTTAMGMNGNDAIHRMAPCPTNPLIGYAAHETRLFKTVDGGKTWFHVGGGWFPYCLIDPVDPNIVYTTAGKGVREMIRSSDGGKTWQNLGRGAFLGIHPTKSGIVYAERGSGELAVAALRAAGGGGGGGKNDPAPTTQPAEEPGLYRSTDGGKTFDRICADAVGYGDFFISPSNPDTMFSARGPAGLYRSRDGGRNWQKLNLEILGPTRITEAGDGSIWLADLATHVVRSTDGGQTWEKVWDFMGVLAADPWDEHCLYMVTQGGIWWLHPRGTTRAEVPLQPPPVPATHQAVEVSAPLLIEQSNTTYKLAGDIVLEGTTRSLALFNRGVKDVVIDGGGHTVTLSGASAIFGDDLENITIRNIRFVKDNEGKAGGTVMYLSNCRNLTISNCELPAGGGAIATPGIFTDNVTIENCTLSGGARNAAAVSGTGRHTIRGCTITGQVVLRLADGSVVENCTFSATGGVQKVSTTDVKEANNTQLPPPQPPAKPTSKKKTAA